MLDSILDWSIVLLPTVLAVGSVLLSLRVPHAKYHRMWYAILIGLGVAISGLTLWQQARSRTSHLAEVGDLKGVLTSLGDQGKKQTEAIAALEGQVKVLTQSAIKESAPSKTKAEVKVESTVAHVRFSTEQIVSTDPANPFAVRAIIQTDRPIAKPDFILLCDGNISGGDFIVSGQAVTMDHRSGYMNEYCGFRFGFGFPEFTPDSPVVATIYGPREFTITQVKDARGMSW